MKMKNRTIKIGHPCYQAWSNNQYAQHDTYMAALRDLLARKVSMAAAHAAIKRATYGTGAYFTISNNRHDPIEIQS